MAKTKAGGRARQGTPRRGNRLGLKLAGGSRVKVGQIIVRQRGSSFRAGEGAGIGRDYTVFAAREGEILFKRKAGKKVVEIIQNE